MRFPYPISEINLEDTSKLQTALLGGGKPPFVATDAIFASALRKISK